MTSPETAKRADARRYLANLRGEIDSAALYTGLAEIEKSPEVAKVYRGLAEVEQSHGEYWKKRLLELGLDVPDPRSRWRSRALIWLARRFGARFILPIATSLEHGSSAYYDAQPEAAAGGLPAAERSHARVIEALAAPVPFLSIAALTRLEGRHQLGIALRAAVLGANDGLVSNLTLVMGVAGASIKPHTILVIGLAGLLAGSCAMAMGEWLSVSTSAESYLRELEVRADEFGPEEEKQQLISIYRAKGLAENEAADLADRMLGSQEPVHATESGTGLQGSPSRQFVRSAWIAAVSSFLLFASGAAFPVLPFVVLGGESAIVASIVLSGIALFAMGAATSLFSGRGPFASGVRQLAIGLGAAAATYMLGRLMGAAIGG